MDGMVVAPILALPGIARDPSDASAQAGIVKVYGIDQMFLALAPDHLAAAGARIPGKLPTTQRRVVAAIRKALDARPS